MLSAAPWRAPDRRARCARRAPRTSARSGRTEPRISRAPSCAACRGAAGRPSRSSSTSRFEISVSIGSTGVTVLGHYRRWPASLQLDERNARLHQLACRHAIDLIVPSRGALIGQLHLHRLERDQHVAARDTLARPTLIATTVAGIGAASAVVSSSARLARLDRPVALPTTKTRPSRNTHVRSPSTAAYARRLPVSSVS